MTELNISPDSAQETQEHIDAMVAKADGTETETGSAEATPERPAWLPEKFASPEDMAKAYAALEQKQSSTPAVEATTEAADTETAEATAEAAADVVAAAGLDMNTLSQKVMNNGDLDADDYAALEKQGIPKEMAQSYVAGQQAMADKLVSEMHASVGGKEEFDNLLSWAGENLPPAEIEAFNNTIDTGSEGAVKLALAGLNARFKAEGGTTPNLLGGKRGGNGSTDVFRSNAELTKAMNDPRYSKDAAYRADVMAKLDRSSIL